MIVISLLKLQTSENILEAAAVGSILTIFGIVLIKSAMGWSKTRFWANQRKRRNLQIQ